MPLSYIKIFVDCLESMEPLDDGERGRLFTALLEYAKTGERPELQGNERFVFPALRAQLDRDAAAYEEMCETNRRNGVKGGRPPKKPAGFSETEKSQEEEKDEEKEENKEKDSSGRPFGPPARTPGRRPGAGRQRGNCDLSPREQEEARKDIERMNKYLLKLRAECAEEERQAAKAGTA